MPEKIHQTIQKRSKSDQVLIGYWNEFKKIPVGHEKVFMAIYDLYFAPKPKTDQEKRLARMSREKWQKAAKIGGWVATGAELGILTYAAVEGFKRLKTRSAILSPEPDVSMTKPQPIVEVIPRTESPPVAVPVRRFEEVVPSTLVPGAFDMEGAKKEFTRLFDALHAMNPDKDTRADALFAAAVVYMKTQIRGEYPWLITNMAAINLVLRNMASHPEVARDLERFLPDRTGGIKAELDFYRRPINIIRGRFVANRARLSGTSPLVAMNTYATLNMPALGEFWQLDIADPRMPRMAGVLVRANRQFEWEGIPRKFRDSA